MDMNTTFADIQNMLTNNDEKFKKQIEYLTNTDQFKKIKRGYNTQNFYFFMAIVLQGFKINKEKDYFENFLKIAYKNQPPKNSIETWRRNVKDFINKEKNYNNSNSNVINKFSEISDNTKVECFFDGTWYDITDNKGNPIFYTNNNKSKVSVFSDEEDKGKTGEERAKEQMKQIVEVLVNGVQNTSQGEFSDMKDIYSLLKSNKQLILNGAPGTGKTFSARNEIADRLFIIKEKTDLEKEKVKKIQMEMVQFHPSYDYTDFIEGIRPALSKSRVEYTLKNGSFKSFCRRAGVMERILASGNSITESTIKDCLKGESQEIINFWLNKIKEDGFNPEEIEKLPPFLFIIDEINRSEISKVIGEVMFCLDADYRGVKGQITTQYSSLATRNTFFIGLKNDKFFIPSNVYIIGTMNDIDRSVEVFDFALRRRFAWHEITAENEMEKVLQAMKIKNKLGKKNYDDYINSIKNLNESIVKLLNLNRHYQLGPSYFAKIEIYMDNNDYKTAKEEVWNNHILQILNEYAKGKRIESEIKKIGNTFMGNVGE